MPMIHVLLTPFLLVPPQAAQQSTKPRAAARGDRTEELVRALPRSSIGVVATAGWDDIRQRIARNAWAEFATQGHWRGMTKLLTQSLDGPARSAASKIELADVLASIGGPVAGCIGITDYGWEGCCLVDAGSDGEAFDEMFRGVWDEIVSTEKTSAIHEYDGASILVVRTGGNDPHYGLFEDRGIYGALIHEDADSVLKRIVELIDRVRGEGEERGFLETQAYYQANKAHAGTPALRLVFNGESFFEALAKEFDDDQLGHTTELGVFDIGWGYMNLDLGAGEDLDFSGGVSIPKDTLLGDFADLLGPVPTHLIDRLPAESTSVSLGNYDLFAAWQLFLDTMANYSPDGFDEIQDGLDQVRDLWDIDVEEDVISQFTGNFASFTMPIPEGESGEQLEAMGLGEQLEAMGLGGLGSLDEGGALLVEFEDPYMVEAALEQVLLVTGIGGMVEEIDYQGYTYQKVDLGASPLMWGFTDDMFVYTSIPTPIHTALSLSEGIEIDEDHLARFRDELKKQGPSVSTITISDSRSTVEVLLTTLGFLEGILELEADPSMRALLDLGLPDGSLVNTYFQGTIVQTLSRRGDGVYLSARAR